MASKLGYSDSLFESALFLDSLPMNYKNYGECQATCIEYCLSCYVGCSSGPKGVPDPDLT